jgi:hypothetical protein
VMTSLLSRNTPPISRTLTRCNSDQRPPLSATADDCFAHRDVAISAIELAELWSQAAASCRSSMASLPVRKELRRPTAPRYSGWLKRSSVRRVEGHARLAALGAVLLTPRLGFAADLRVKRLAGTSTKFSASKRLGEASRKALPALVHFPITHVVERPDILLEGSLVCRAFMISSP